MGVPPREFNRAFEKIELFLKIYPDYNKRVEQENQLINNRITWMITIQSFLIATVGLVYSYYFQALIAYIATVSNKTSLQIVRKASLLIWRLMMSFSAIGLVVSVIAGFLIYTACVSIESIEEKWEEQKIEVRKQLVDAEQIRIFSLLPEITNGGPSFLAKAGKTLLMLIPVAFAFLWLSALYVIGLAKIKPL
jgi:hypothetical protein